MATDELAAAIRKYAPTIGANPLDLATVYSYETGGTLNPWQRGPTTQWGQHRGLIQWGEPQRRQYGVTEQTPVADQVAASVRYLKDRGFQPGMGLLDMYSTVNAGRPGLYNASDANNGGAPGTVADKVNNQMAAHRAKAEALIGGNFSLSGDAQREIPDTAPTPAGRFGVSGVEPSPTASPAMTAPAPAADEPISAAKILSAFTQGGSALAQPQAQPAPAVQPLMPMPRRSAPFDAASFFALLKR